MTVFADTTYTADLISVPVFIIVVLVVGVVAAVGLFLRAYINGEEFGFSLLAGLSALMVAGGFCYLGGITLTSGLKQGALVETASLMDATWQDGVGSISLTKPLVCSDTSGRALKVVPRDGSEPLQVAVRTARTGAFLGIGGNLTLTIVDASACSPSAR